MVKENDPPADRRPIASRNVGLFKAMSTTLVKWQVSPNTISMFSVVFAAGAAAAILATGQADPGASRLLWLAAAALVQLRLLANMLDGMVAVESGKSSRLGELFNEVPDRIADVMIILPLGFVAGSSLHLAYAASILALFVAYVRAMGAAAGGGQVFAGIMAKPKRMFLITLLCLFQAVAPASWQQPWLLEHYAAPGLVLAMICLGCVITSCTRLATITANLRSK